MISDTTDIRYLKGVGEKRAQLLSKLGVDTIADLLTFYPRSYKDLSKINLIYDTYLDETVCVRAKILTPITEHYIRKNMTIYKFVVGDKSGAMSVTLFNTKYTAQKLHEGSEYLFYGKMAGGMFKREMSSPEIYESANNSVIPVYSLTSGISSKYIYSIVRTAIQSCSITEILPSSIREKYNLCDINFAIQNIHFPKSKEALDRAKERLVFEELFLLQSGMTYLKNKRRGKTAVKLKNDFTKEFVEKLPFAPTNSQIKCVKEALSDMSQSVPMSRLLQGDVGSGKTLVAAALMYNTVKNGYQAALMAPTVILAEQHYNNFLKLFENTGINCTLITSAVSAAKRRKIAESIKCGEVDIVIGTHSVLNEEIQFDDLGLVVTDEQHRFGVAQRDALSKKGNSPHTLVMSATPIPRTLAMVIYGELDVSIINEYPKGRQQIECYSVGRELRERVYNYIKKHIDEGRQGYIVCPLVEEGETERVSAEECYKTLKDNQFKDYKLGLLHGKMSSSAKEKVMWEFVERKIDLLISTTVIEVGVDVPNAAIMVIEDAEMFGLSQLHQLRGRIGRGKHKSTCILISGSADKTTNNRLSAICHTNDGFKIAEEDLKLRGPGDFMGMRQHGLPQMKIADLNNDYNILNKSGEAAKELLIKDADLSAPENLKLKEKILKMFITV